MTDHKPEQEVIPPNKADPRAPRFQNMRFESFRSYGAGVRGRSPLLDKFMVSLGVLSGVFIAALAVYGIAQLYAGFIGIEYHLGTGWAVIFLLLSLMARITLPVTIGAFFGAMDVWGWHWFTALVFAAPGLVLSVLLLAQNVIARRN